MNQEEPAEPRENRTRRAGGTSAVLVGLSVLSLLGLSSLPAHAAAPTITNADPPGIESTNALPSSATNAPLHDVTQAATLDTAWVETRLQQLRDNTGLEEATRSALQKLYEECRTSLISADRSRSDRDRFAALREAIPERLQALEAQVEAPPPTESPVEATAPLTLLEETLTRLESEFSANQSRLRKLQSTPQERTDRLIEIARALAENRAQLQELRKLPTADSKVPSPPEVVATQTASRTLRTQALELRIEALTEEQLFYEAGRELLTAEIEQAARDLDRARAEIDRARQRVTDQRQGKVDMDLSRLSGEADRARQLGQNHPLVNAIVQTNRALVSQRANPEGILHKIDQVNRQLASTKEKLRLLNDSFTRVRSRLALIDSAGVRVDEAVGHLLRQELRRLPSYEVPHGQLQEFRSEISSTLANLVRFQDQRADLHFVDTQAAELAAAESASTPDDALQTALVELLRAQRDYLDHLIDDNNRYLRELLAVEVTSQTINSELETFRQFISERVLWIRSSPRFTLGYTEQQQAYLASSWSRANWIETGRWVAEDFRQSKWIYGIALILAILLPASRGWLRRRENQFTAAVTQDRSAPMRMTVAALVLTLLRILPCVWPTLILGWRLARYTGGQIDALFVVGMGEAIVQVSLAFLVAWALRELCRPKGIAESHFHWPTHNTAVIHRNITWLVLVNLPVTFLVALAHRQGTDIILGQGLYLLQTLVLALFAHSLFRPRRGLHWRAEDSDPEQSWSWQGRFIYLLGVGLPLLLLTAAYFGYYYSALKVQAYIRLTIYAILGCVFLRALILRWLDILQVGARQKARELFAQQASSAGPEGQKQRPKPLWFSLSEAMDQSRSLVRVGMWLVFLSASFVIWNDMFPALRVLDNIPVPGFGARQTTTQPMLAAGESTTAPSLSPLTPNSGTDGGESPSPVASGAEEVQGASLGDLLVAIVILVAGFLAMGYLPGLLQLLLLNRLDLRPGVGYAVATLMRYTVVLVALLLACDQLGITWSKVQWIAAAFSLGIAFGLQEMFANFFSGLIILFERPIRIGDIVTVGDVSGNVTRINIRATTITDWDRREYLVPNKDFITGKLLNWTLSDPITRVLVEVGIAYGSDTDRAEKLLLEAAKENPHVMANPEPRAIFWGFGDNALQFRLYVHIPKRNFYFDLLHGLTTTINRKFKEAGITIAFPQRDVHLHPTRPIEVRVLPGNARSDAPQAPPTTPPDG